LEQDFLQNPAFSEDTVGLPPRGPARWGLPWVPVALAAVVAVMLPFALFLQGGLALMAIWGAAATLLLMSVHPLVSFSLYFAALFFSDTTIPGLPVSVNQVVGVLFLLSAGTYALRAQAQFPGGRLLALLVVLSAYFAVNAALGEDAERGLVHMRYVVIYLVVAVALASSLTTERSILALSWVILLLTVASAGYGVAQAIENDLLSLFTGNWSDDFRVRGTAKNAILFGWHLVFAFPFGFLLFSESRSAPVRLLVLALTLFILAVAFLTFNRQTYVVIAILVSGAVLLFSYQNRKFLIGLLSVFAAGAAVAVIPLILKRLLHVRRTEYDYSFLERRDSWFIGWQMVHDHPIFGVGLGSFPSVFKTYIPSDYPTFFVQYYGGDQLKFPDIGYLQILSEGGIVGFGLVALLLGYALWSTWRFHREARAAGDQFAQNLAAVGILLLVLILLTTVIQDTFLYARVWITFGLLLLVNRQTLGIRAVDSPSEKAQSQF